MEKKAYIIPVTNVMHVELHPLMVLSGGGDKQEDPQVDPNADNTDDPNRSRRTYNVWEDEEVVEEEDY